MMTHPRTAIRRKKPNLVAPGEAILAAQAGSPEDVLIASGTSMAAPHVSGAIALLLPAQEKQIQVNPKDNFIQFNAVQICAALQKTTQNFNKNFTSIVYGVLDVQNFLEELGCRNTTTANQRAVI